MAIVEGTNSSELLNALDGVTTGDDFIHGYDGNDAIDASNGNDSIWGGNGADHMDGGNGIDTADYDDATSGVWVSLESGRGYTGAAAGDTLVRIENLYGSTHDDWLIGNSEGNLLRGYFGQDHLQGGGGADHLQAGSGNDVLEGGADADILDGGEGVDLMIGGVGGDVYYVEANDTVTELAGEGIDAVISRANAYTLTDNVENLSLIETAVNVISGAGNALDNTITGNLSSNVLNGMDGADIILGGKGLDTIFGGNHNDTILGQTDNDIVYGGAGTDAIAGGSGGDILFGEGDADIIFGEDGADLILGGAGGDLIRGGLGGDLYGFNVGDNGDLIQGFNDGGVRDGIDLRSYFDATGFAGNNPRATGILQVYQNGVDTDVYLHGGFAFRIEGVVAAAIDDTYFLFQ